MRRVTVLALAVALLASSAVVAIAAGGGTSGYPATSGSDYTGVRPTAVGLPQIGASGTIGASDLPSAIRSYVDSGRYDADLGAVDGAARDFLVRRLAERGRPPRTCKVTYKRKRVRGVRKPLYKRVRRCTPTSQPAGKPAIVLDIDETSLSNYQGLVSSNFSSTGTVAPAASGTGTAIAPTLALYGYARQNGVAVFFVTGRPSQIQAMTESNLRNTGYDQGWDGLAFKPGDQGTEEFKAAQRAAIEGQGFHIYANVGDQESDLDGGHAERGFKLPNPFYFIAD